MGKKIIIKESQLKSIVKNILLENEDPNPLRGKTVILFKVPGTKFHYDKDTNNPEFLKSVFGKFTISNSYIDWKNNRIIVDLQSKSYNSPNIQLAMKCNKQGFSYREDRSLFDEKKLVYNVDFWEELEIYYCEKLVQAQTPSQQQKVKGKAKTPSVDYSDADF